MYKPALCAIAVFFGDWRTAARLALIVLLSCFAVSETNKVIVKTSLHNTDTTVVDVGPAVPQDYGDGHPYEVAGMNGWIISCNNDARSNPWHQSDADGHADRDLPAGMARILRGLSNALGVANP